MRRIRRLASARTTALAACVLALAPGAVAADGAYGSALPRFALFGWVSPPRESTTVARYAELAATGFNLALPAWGETGTWADNLVRLDCSRPAGLRCLLLDNDLDSVSTAEPSSLVFADTIVARYRSDPAFLGYYLGDEPTPDTFARLGEWFDILRARDPEHPAWNSLRPRGGFASRADFQAYVEEYVAATRPAVLCNNQYDFQVSGDAGFLTENVAALGAVARANGIPFWGVVQLVEHWIFRHVTPGMLRWEVAQWLAGGAHGVGYFTYWTPPPVYGYEWGPAMIEWGTGARTEYYDIVTALNARLAPLGDTLAVLRWLATEHAGSVPAGGVPFSPDTVVRAVEGRATLGWFADSCGTTYLFLASADSLSPRTVTLALAGGWQPARLDDDGATWDPLDFDGDGRIGLTLAGGDFTLLRFPPRSSPAGVQPPPGPAAGALRVTPNPAPGRVRFDISGAGASARLEVMDLAGRVVWSRAVPPGGSALTWSGERGAPGGVYFVRLRDRRGTAVRRFVRMDRR